MTEQDKVTVDDIICIVKTEEQTNSVEEVRKLRGRENKTAKRFTIIYGVDENPFEWDLMDNEKDALICRCNGKPICDLLNELHEENQKCKEYNAILYSNTAKNEKELLKENEQLRTKNNAYIQDIGVFKEENTHLKLENEQLKLLIKKVLETTPIEHSLALDLKNSIRELYK